MGHMLDISPGIAPLGYQLIGGMVFAAKVAVPLILIALLIQSYVKGVIFGEGTKIDYRPIIRGIFLMFVIAFYVEISGVISAFISAFINLIPRRPDVLEVMQEMAEATMSSSQDPDPSDGWYDNISATLREMLSITAAFASIVREGLLYLVRSGMSLVRSMLLVFLYLTGPVALVFCMIPGFQSSGLAWLKGFVGVQFWELTLRLLDHMVYSYHLYAAANLDLTDSGYILGVNLVAVIMYLISPSITSYFISAGSAGGFLGRAAQVGAGLFFATKALKAKKAAKGSVSQGVKEAHQKKS